MDRRIYGILLLPALFAAACSSADLDADRPAGPDSGLTGLGDGLCVVDFAVGEAASTKAFGENLPASQRISSLIYLLYDADGNIVKERVVPDIGPETIWPLRRPDAGGNMTWEQREALKDTLLASASYTAVFIANAEPDLFGLDGMSDDAVVLHYKSLAGGTASGQPLYGLADGGSQTGYDYLPLRDIYLSLPAVPFSDGNMFYMCVKEIPALTTGSEEATPGVVNCPVQLHRIVSRTDIRRIEPQTDYLADAEAWSAYIQERVDASLYPQSVRPALFDSVKEFMDGLATDFGLQAFQDIPDMPGYITFADRMKSDYVAEAILAGLDGIDGIEGAVIQYCYEQCAAEQSGLLSRMPQWNGAEVTLDVPNLADRFTVYGQTPSHAGSLASPVVYKADSGQAAEPGLLSLAGFGDGILNRVTSFTFTPQGSAAWTVPVPDGLVIWYGANKRNSVVCDPVASIECNEQDRLYQMSVSLDLGALLRSGALSLGWDDAYAPVLEKVAEGGSHGSMESFTFNVSFPEIAGNISAVASFQ